MDFDGFWMGKCQRSHSILGHDMEIVGFDIYTFPMSTIPKMDGDFDGIVMIHIEIMGQNPTSYSTESCLTSVCAAEVTRPLE